jgi:hypothetical protein
MILNIAVVRVSQISHLLKLQLLRVAFVALQELFQGWID